MEKKHTTKLKQLALVSALITPFSANADILSFAIGGGGWNASPTGNFQKTTDPAAVDVKENLFWKEETNTYFYATLEHPVPILPNVRLISTKIDQRANRVRLSFLGCHRQRRHASLVSPIANVRPLGNQQS